MERDAAASYEEAQRLVSLGRSREAVAPLREAVARQSRAGVAWRLLADIQLVAGDFAGALHAYDRLLAAVVPDDRLRPAADALAEGRPRDAERALRALLGADGSNLPAAHLMAEALARRGELAPAEALLVHCLERAPRLHLARQSLALLLHRQGRHADALAHLDQLLAHEPRNTRNRAVKAAILAEIGDYAGAAQVTAALLEDFPDQPLAWIVHGNGLRTLGRVDEAEAAFQRALALDPVRADAWWSLANLKSYRFAPDQRAEMTARLADASDGDSSLLHFALAKADEDENRAADAFAHYASANARCNGGCAPMTRTAAWHLRPPLGGAVHPGSSSPRGPVGAIRRRIQPSIAGLLRLGSTLVEQILAEPSPYRGDARADGHPGDGRLGRRAVNPHALPCPARRMAFQPPSPCSATTIWPAPAPNAGSAGRDSSTRRRGTSCTSA